MENGNGKSKVDSLREVLESEKVRLARWLALSGVFAVFVTSLSVLTRSAFFFVAAGLAWFFVWNRWKCRKFIRSLPKPPLSGDAEQMQWLHSVLNIIEHPPKWWSVSEYTSAIILMGLYAVVTFFVASTSGIWMKMLYGVSWAIILIVTFFRVKYVRKLHASKNS
jgi:hypothetical protein